MGILIVVALIAGCIETSTEPSTSSSTTGVDAGGSPMGAVNATDANTTVETVTPDVEIAVSSAPSTKAESLTLFVNTTGPISATILVNGTETFRGPVDADRTWNIPLVFGVNAIDVTAVAPSVSLTESIHVVRLGATTLRMNYGVWHPSYQGSQHVEDYEIWIDLSSRPSAGQYEKAGGTHVDFFTAHDQLFVFETITGKHVEYSYSASFQGFSVSRIDGAGSPVSASSPPWWCYTVNGDSNTNGISIQPIVPGDAVVWTLGSCT